MHWFEQNILELTCIFCYKTRVIITNFRFTHQ